MLLRHTSQYMISSAIVAVLGFLSAAVFTRLLSPGDYGVYTIGLSIANFVSATAFTWVRYSVMRFESEGDKADVRMTSLAAYVVSAATAPAILIFVHLVAHVGWDRAALAVGLSLGLSLFELGQEILRSRLRVRAFMIGSVLRSAFAFGVCIVIAKLGGGGLGQLAGAATAYYLAAAISGREIWRGPRAPIDVGKLKLFFWLGLSVTAAGFLFTFQLSLDRLFIAWRFGDSEAGLYGASADVVRQIILIPAGSVAAAAFPLTVRVFATGTAEETRRQLERSAELLLTVLAPAAVGLALTAPYLISFLLGPAFRATAMSVMPILAFAWLFQSISQTYINVSFHLSMKQSLSIPHALATLIVNAALPVAADFAFRLRRRCVVGADFRSGRRVRGTSAHPPRSPAAAGSRADPPTRSRLRLDGRRRARVGAPDAQPFARRLHRARLHRRAHICRGRAYAQHLRRPHRRDSTDGRRGLAIPLPRARGEGRVRGLQIFFAHAASRSRIAERMSMTAVCE